MKYKVYDIVYETDGEEVDLPTEMTVEVDDEQEIANAVSDKTGWLVVSMDYEPVE